MKQGAPKEKLMIGMPTYGRSFTLVNKDKFDIGAPASGGGIAGNFTNEPGFLSYYEVFLIHPDYYFIESKLNTSITGKNDKLHKLEFPNRCALS